MKMLDDLAMAVRSLLVRAVVLAIDDTGAEQQVSMRSHYGHDRSRVPVYQPFGFSSHAPLDGAIAPIIQVAGDAADPLALPPYNPSVARFGDLGEGDTVAYDACGQRLHFHNGKLVEIQATSELRVGIGGKTVLDITADGATLSVPLNATAGITTTTVEASEDVTAAGVSLAQHLHRGVQRGADQSGTPIAS
ncbi:phage baseplate assembly protein [Gluconacetobacter sp.]|uniref:phage baseplate assembly protein domain-containing protein n=1 Tax=Gluconacetobacter sp. TaxID=1935994 RepID=UPI0039EA7CE2